MAIGDRPYVGTWELGKQTVVKHTPDARVLINGQEEFAICATCNKKTDFNKYITTVSVDPSTDPVTTATISLVVPRHASDVFSHDGNYVLEPGLEVVIQMRGYFPVKGYAAKGQEENESGLASEETPVYPYYQVFRGVVTEVSHEFSGGFYTASVSCANILHFWQYLYLSTNGSVFGTTPDDSGVVVDLQGHRFTGLSPYGIIYTLMRVGFGSAFGVNWTISQTTNISAIDNATGESLFKHAAQWWERRWQESSMRLRMYGFDGGLFNAFEQAFLGIFDGEKNANLIQSFGVKVPKDYDYNNTVARANAARAVGYTGTETIAQVAGDDGYKIDAAKMQAYTLDLGRLGSVNFFETEYMTKLEIANAAKEITGFEFYQDVDGDIVFKPPFYNLDTSSDPVYVISDRDLISISESEREPEATYVKGSGSLFQNFTGILSGEFGDRQGKYVDWRLVAKFGWKETSFESHYYSGSKQMFVGSIMRLDVANMEMRSASITIPLRPELRPGYPVYVEYLDCFYYIKSMSHSFAAGGSCQTTLTCAAKRAKWLPPGLPDRAEGGSSLPRLDQVRLGNPGEYPPMPLYAFSEDMGDSVEGSSGPPRIIGYPNVVMALDPNKINPTTIPGMPTLSADTLFDVALSIGIMRRNPDDPENTYLLNTGDDTFLDNEIIQKNELLTSYGNIAAELQSRAESDPSFTPTLSNQSVSAEALVSEGLVSSEAIGTVILAVFRSDFGGIEDADNLNRYMALQRSLKNVFGEDTRDGQPVKGDYRYFSSSAPDEEDQSPSEFLFDSENGSITKTNPGKPDESVSSGEITLLRQVGDRIRVESGYPERAFRVYGLNADDDADTVDSPYVDVTTRDIRFINFCRHGVRVPIKTGETGVTGLSKIILDTSRMAEVIADRLRSYAFDELRSGESNEIEDVFNARDTLNQEGYAGIYQDLRLYATTGLLLDDKNVNDALELYNPANTGSDGTGGFYNSFTGFFKSVNNTTQVVDVLDPQVQEILLQFPDSTPGDDEIIALYQAEFEQSPPLIDETTASTVRRAKTGTVSAVTGKPGEAGIKLLSNQIGKSLGGLLGTIQTAYQKKKEAAAASSDNPDDLEPDLQEFAALGVLLRTFPSYQGVEDGKYVFLTTNYKLTPFSTAVLPVSDNRGYEVYGAMAYGRGLDIRSYKGLLETAGSPTVGESMLSVEKFFSSLSLNGADVAKSVRALDPETKATLAAELEATSDADLVSKIEALRSSDSDSIFIRNTPITSRSRGMSNTAAISIAELADLTADGDAVCLCKGVEATYFLQAFTGEFVELAGDEAVNDFLLDEAAVSGEKHQITRQALAGQALDTRFENKLEEVGKNAWESVRSLGRTTESEFQRTRDDLASATDDLLAGTSEAQQVDLSPDEGG